MQELEFILATCEVEPVDIFLTNKECNLTLRKHCGEIANLGGEAGRQQKGRCAPIQSMQQLVQKDSLKNLSIRYSIPTYGLLMAVTNGLQHRREPLEHLLLTVDTSLAISSLDGLLLDLGFTIGTKMVKTARICIFGNGHKDACIFDLPRHYRGDSGRVPSLWIQLTYQGVNIMNSWKEWLPYLCFALGIKTIEMLGFDGCPPGCDTASGIVSTIPVNDVEINLTDDYANSTGFLDLSHANKHLKRIAIIKHQIDKGGFRCACCGPVPKRIPLILNGEVRFAFPSSIQELRFGRKYDRKSILVSMEYITKALASFPKCNNYDNPSQLAKVTGILPEDYLQTDDNSRKSLHRNYLDAAWNHCELQELSLEGIKKLGTYRTQIGPIQNLDDDKSFKGEVECMLKLNQAGRSYVYNPDKNYWWSGVCTLAWVQKLLKPELHPSAIYFLVREDPALLRQECCKRKAQDQKEERSKKYLKSRA